MPAANRYTCTEFLASVRRKGHIPPSQTAFQDADLLAIAYDELSTSIMSQVKAVREGFYKTYVDLTPTQSGYFNIPTRAIAISLDDIQLVNGNTLIPVSRTESSDQFSTNASPFGYYSFELINDQILCKPNPVSGNIRFWYMQRPNTLVPVSQAAQVTSMNLVSNTLFFAGGLPTAFNSSQLYDCIQDQPHFRWQFTDLLPNSMTTTSITFPSLPYDAYGNILVQVGDWVALAGQSPVPQLPVEFSPLLVQRTIVKYYEIQNYENKMQVAQKKLDEMEKAIGILINPRVSSEPKRIRGNSNFIGGYRRFRSFQVS